MKTIPLCAHFSAIKFKSKCGAGSFASARDCPGCARHRSGTAAHIFEETDDRRQLDWDLMFRRHDMVGV